MTTVEQPDRLILSVSQRHIVRPVDVVATTGTLRVGFAQCPGATTAASVAAEVLAVVHANAAVPLCGEVIAPLYDVSADDTVGLEVFLTVALTTTTEPPVAAAVTVTFAEDDQPPRTGTLTLPQSSSSSVRVVPSPATALASRQGLHGEVYWPPPPAHRAMQTMTVRLDTGDRAPGQAVAIFHILANLCATTTAQG